MTPFYGGPVSGDNRFARPDLEAALVATLDSTAGAKLFGLRRIGKSTLSRYAAEEMPKRGFAVAEIDAQGMRSLDALLSAVVSALRPQATGLVDHLLGVFAGSGTLPVTLRAGLKAMFGAGGDRAGPADIEAYWQPISDHIVTVLREKKPKLLLCIDELPFLLQNMIADDPGAGARRADQLLAALRAWRAEGLRMVLCGSIGVAALARKHGFRNDHLNDLSDFDVPELTDTEARALVVAATRSSPAWTEAHTGALMTEVGCFYPCFLTKALIELRHGTPPPPAQFEEIFNRRIRPDLHKTFLDQFDRRFKFYESISRADQRNLITPLLRAVIPATGPVPETGLPLPEPYQRPDRSAVMAMLVEDGFLRQTIGRDGTKGFAPASRIASLWWAQAGL